MPLVTTDAIILQTFSYSETSKVMRLVTRTAGARSVIAKGARRPKSRYGGVLEPFTEGVATFYVKEGRDLHTLSGFELVRTRQQLGLDLVRFGGASLLAELVIRTGSQETDEPLYERVRHGLDRLTDVAEPGVQATVLAEAWSLIGHLGFAPALDRCVVCGRPVDDEARVFFDYTAGGVHCEACGAGAPGRDLPARARAELLRFCRGEAPPLEGTAAHWQLLARFLAYHVTELGSLRSLKFLSKTIEASP